ncbi:MAG: hypothetical protein JAY84_10205 [Candidatus Thiodiazotropha taylori]|nr:hypothetical protein [Candidatus Thiodiazotropha taylori]
MKKSGTQFSLFDDVQEFSMDGIEEFPMDGIPELDIEPIPDEILAEWEAAGKELMDSLEPFTFNTGESNEN